MKLDRAVDRRRYSRVKASWPVAVFAKGGIFSGSTIDLGAWGARVRLDRPLFEEWRLVRLRVCPPDEPVFDVMALVWRVEADGVALFFFDEWERDIPEERIVNYQAVAQADRIWKPEPRQRQSSRVRLYGTEGHAVSRCHRVYQWLLGGRNEKSLHNPSRFIDQQHGSTAPPST